MVSFLDQQLGKKESGGNGWSTKKKIGVGILGFVIFLIAVGVLVPSGNPEFKVSNLKVSKAEVSRGKSVQVQTEVKNTGDGNGSYNAKLMVNGELFENKKVFLNSGEKKTINFEIVPRKTGVFNVKLENLQESFKAILPFLEVLDAKKEDGTLGIKVRIFNSLANDVELFGSKTNDEIRPSAAMFSVQKGGLITEVGVRYRAIRISDAPSEIPARTEASFWVYFPMPDEKLDRIVYDEYVMKKIEAPIPKEYSNPKELEKLKKETGWLPVTSFSGSMPSDTLDKTDTFRITEENWRINWKVEKIPLTLEEAVLKFSVVDEDKGKIGGDTVVLLYEDVKEGSLNFHQKGKFHIKLLGKYVDWKFEVEEFIEG